MRWSLLVGLNLRNAGALFSLTHFLAAVRSCTAEPCLDLARSIDGVVKEKQRSLVTVGNCCSGGREHCSPTERGWLHDTCLSSCTGPWRWLARLVMFVVIVLQSVPPYTTIDPYRNEATMEIYPGCVVAEQTSGARRRVRPNQGPLIRTHAQMTDEGLTGQQRHRNSYRHTQRGQSTPPLDMSLFATQANLTQAPFSRAAPRPATSRGARQCRFTNHMWAFSDP